MNIDFDTHLISDSHPCSVSSICYVYFIFNTTNKRFYIGKTTDDTQLNKFSYLFTLYPSVRIEFQKCNHYTFNFTLLRDVMNVRHYFEFFYCESTFDRYYQYLQYFKFNKYDMYNKEKILRFTYNESELSTEVIDIVSRKVIN